MQETQVQSVCWEDPLEMEVATYSSSLAQRIPSTEEPLMSNLILHSPGKAVTIIISILEMRKLRHSRWLTVADPDSR